VDWEDLKTFLAVARHGNLSAGARSLGVSQTTMGRRLEGLQARAGARLLTRTPSGFHLTPAGERILPRVERMETEALAAERAVSGEDDRLEGLVRVTSVDAFAARILTPGLARLARLHPHIVCEMITDTRALSLARREADIAVRLAPFEQHEAVVRRIADMAFGLYASPAYLAKNPFDETRGGEGHRLIVMQDDLAGLPEALWLREIAPAAATGVLANSRAVQSGAARAGMGLANLPRYLGDADDALVRIETVMPPPVRGVWIGVHRDMRQTPRIRVVLDILAEEIAAARDKLAPTL
jgi:DNA-binding transcriptional LysR family regulator